MKEIITISPEIAEKIELVNSEIEMLELEIEKMVSKILDKGINIRDAKEILEDIGKAVVIQYQKEEIANAIIQLVHLGNEKKLN